MIDPQTVSEQFELAEKTRKETPPIREQVEAGDFTSMQWLWEVRPSLFLQAIGILK